MFDSLQDKLGDVFKRLTNRGRLSEADVDEAMKEVRLALLEADVNFKVAREFVKRVRERSVGIDVLESISPGQQVVKIVNDELTAILGGSEAKLEQSPKPPTVVMLVGLQGSGKTTSIAKLAHHLRKRGQRSLLVASDLRRPAAVEQLVALGKQLDIPVYEEGTTSTPLQVSKNGLKKAQDLGVQWMLLDTGGRLHIDDELMKELEDVKKAVHPMETVLVVDSMTGQDAVQAAQEFNDRIGLTGLILSKLDGDARGGAALSIVEVTGVPIKFVGVGEKTDALEPFYPERMASRILGMGDVLTLIEKAQETFDESQAKVMQEKMRKAAFTLEDFLQQLQQLKKMGPLSSVMEMIPGLSKLTKQMPGANLDESHMKRTEAIIQSMTTVERNRPDVIDGSRRRRIALGSGTTPQDVNQMLNQFRQSQKLMKQLASGKGQKKLMRMLG
ncbi:MAG: signal recognition particle subunit SRP54 [Chloroflexi bacterium]|nr:MAG: signal recognition particle subunit SRP54 [Chloroflexota bacterium]